MRLTQPNWVIRMGEKLHGNITAMTLAGLITAVPTGVVFKNWADNNREKRITDLIARAAAQEKQYGHVLMYSGTELSRTDDTWARGDNSRVTILADEPVRVSFETAKKHITDHYKNDTFPKITGVFCGGLAGALGVLLLSFGTGYCRNRTYAMRQSAQNRAAMKKHGLDHFNLN